MQKRKGFTTVELVIVIAVIAILATALIPTFGGLIKSANHNVDIQNARNLTSQIMMYTIDKKITTESDLRDAINAGMGEGYYESLEAKSSKYGYNYWYDVTAGQVIVKTEVELLEEANNAFLQAHGQAMLLSGASGITTPTWNRTPSNGLMPSSIRSFSILLPGYDPLVNDKNTYKEYILLGVTGQNPLIKLTTALANVDETNYGTILSDINNLEDNPINKVIKEIANSTPILNSNGLFIPQAAIDKATDETNPVKIDNIYVPLGVGVLDGTAVYSNSGAVDITPSDLLVENFDLYVPNGTKVATDVLVLQNSENQEIHMNIKEEELADYFYSNATNATIVLPSGSYVQQADGTFKNLATDQPVKDAQGNAVQTGDYGKLTSYGVSIYSADGKKTVFLDGTTLYISYDHTGDIILDANTFKGIMYEGTPEEIKDANIPVLSISCNVGTIKGTKSTFTRPADGSTITVQVRSASDKKEYTVRHVDVIPDRYQIEKIDSQDTINGIFNLTYDTREDSKKISWSINPYIPLGYYDATLGEYVVLTDNVKTNLSLDTTVKLADTTNFSLVNNKLTATGYLSTLATGGEKDNIILDFVCAGATKTVKIVLHDESLSAFDVADNTKNMETYGNPNNNTFVVGTEGKLLLSSLFKSVSDKFDTFTLNIPFAGASIPIEKDQDWATIDLVKMFKDNEVNITGTPEVTISLGSYGGVAKKLNVRFIPGAYNVSTPDDWTIVAGKTNTSIVVLNEININATEQSDVTAAAAAYSIELGNAKIFGNLNPINITGYVIKNQEFNYLIRTSGGTLEHVIINGPDYGDKISVTAPVHGPLFGTNVSCVHATPANGKSVIIKDSYLSGFRAPLTLQSGGTADINDTTIYGGNFANINIINAPATLKLTNVITAQPHPNSGKQAGIGIFIKPNVGAGTKIISQNLTQYNFVTAQQLVDATLSSLKIMEDLTSVDLTADDIKDELAPLAHGDYYHAGIMESSAADLEVNKLADTLLSSILKGYSLQSLMDGNEGSSSFDLTASTGEGSDLNYTASLNFSKDVTVTTDRFIKTTVLTGTFGVKAYGLGTGCDANCICHTTNANYPDTVAEFLANRVAQ